MPLNVHFGEALEPDELAELRARLSPEVQITASPDDPAPASYHILVAGRPNAAQITASPNLHTVIVPWAGVPESTRQLMADYPQIAVHNLHYNAAPTAEMAMTLLLAAAKLDPGTHQEEPQTESAKPSTEPGAVQKIRRGESGVRV